MREITTIALFPLLVTALFCQFSHTNYTILQLVLAYLILLAPWSGYVLWKKNKKILLPVYSIIGFAFWLNFGMTLFLADQTYTKFWFITPDIVTKILIAVTLALCFIWLGMRSNIANKILPEQLMDISDSSHNWSYIRGLFVIFSGVGFLPINFFGEEFRQALILGSTIIPLVIFSILYRAYLQNKSLFIDKCLLLVYFIFAIAMGLSNGWIGQVISILICAGIIFIIEKGRIPYAHACMVIFLIFFLQAGREEFRKTFWVANSTASTTEKVSFWLTHAIDYWQNTDLESDKAHNSIQKSFERMSLIKISAIVFTKTPEIVPFQNGQTYSYLLFGWMPRFLWKDKPSINDANQFFQVAYGLTDKGRLNTVSISAGILAESYMNFGWLGIPLIMYFLGIFFDFFQALCFSKRSGLLFSSIGIVFVYQYINIGSQLSQYLASTVQQILFCLIVFLPVIRFRQKKNYTSHAYIMG